MSITFPIEKIVKNPWQTRHGDPDPDYIAELAGDIAANSLLQKPAGRLLLGGLKVTGDYPGHLLTDIEENPDLQLQLAFGHNRLAAYKLLAEQDPDKYGEMPVEVQDLDDEQMADYAWAENERRREHSPLDRALAIRKRMDDFGWNQEQVGEHLKLSRPAVSNALRLLNLPDDMQTYVHTGEISARQALALLSLYDLPDTVQRMAESSWREEIRPSNIVEKAKGGASSDYIWEKTGEIITTFGRSLGQAEWPLNHEFAIKNVQSPGCHNCPVRATRGKDYFCLDKACFDVKQSAWRSSQLPGMDRRAPATIEVQSQVSPPPPAPIPTPSVATTRSSTTPAPASRPALPETPPEPKVIIDDPYEWDKCQITVTVTWMPNDGNEEGRMVIIGGRTHQDAPVMRTFRENHLLLAPAIHQLLDELKVQLASKNGAKK